MATTVLVTFSDARSVADVQKRVATSVGTPGMAGNKMIDYVAGMVGKNFPGTMAVQVQNGDGVAASGTVTAASVTAGDTVTICGVVLTAHASTQNTTNFVVGVSNTADAAALATCINANTTLNVLVSAAAASGVCTITALTSGVAGNGYTLASSNGTRLAVSGARLASGAADTGTSNTYTFQ